MRETCGPPTVFADESNNTGNNLLDANQPVFCSAGVCLTDELAMFLVEDVSKGLPRTQREPKYSSLSKTGRGREALTWAFSHLPPTTTRAYVADKRFMVVTKMVDLLVEPLAYADGFNLYTRGEAHRLASTIHFYGPVLGDPGKYEKMLQAFVYWARQLCEAETLFAAISDYRESVMKPWFAELVGTLEMPLRHRAWTPDLIACMRSMDVLDPAVPATVCLCTDFGASLGRFRLVHDSSKVVDRHAWVLARLPALPDPSDIGRSTVDLPVAAVEFADSTAFPQLQLADWAAGAVRQWATHKATGRADAFASRLAPVIIPWLIGGIWPGLDPEAY